MLFPTQVIALHRRLAEGRDVDQIDGLALSRKNGVPTDWGRVVVSDPPIEVDFQPPEFVLGEPEDPSCLADVRDPVSLEIPAKAIRSFRDVRIVGWCSLLSGSGFYCTRREFRQSDGSLEALSGGKYDGLVVKDGLLIHATGQKDRPLIAGNTLFLSALEPDNHGSFVFRMLPKLLYFLEQGIGVDQLVVPSRTPAIVDAVDLIGLGSLPLYTVREAMALEFADVFVIDDFDLKGAMSAASMSQLRALPAGRAANERIYVSRRLNAHRPLRRPLLNEAEIESLATRMGFRVVFPECLRFRQQVALFAGARFIVGPSGSGMLNTLFSEPGGRVLDIESFHSTVRQHARIYSSGSHHYGFAFGKFDPQDRREPRHLRRWTASADMIAEGIERLQAAPVLPSKGPPHAGGGVP